MVETFFEVPVEEASNSSDKELLAVLESIRDSYKIDAQAIVQSVLRVV